VQSEAVAEIRLLLVDDHPMFREGLARLLEKQPSLSVVGDCGTSAEALILLKKCAVNMVLLDVDLGQERAIDFITRARKGGFDGKVLIVTAGVDGAEALQLMQSGVAGILHKQRTGEELRAAIRQVAEGGVWLEDEYLPMLFRTVDRTKPSGKPQLTEREKAIVRFLFEGQTNKEIGQQLDLSEGAVKASLRQLFAKVSVHTRSQLVKVALEQYREQL
jgi:DNA-binding NarL/FixJ family response regulator